MSRYSSISKCFSYLAANIIVAFIDKNTPIIDAIVRWLRLFAYSMKKKYAIALQYIHLQRKK